MTAHPDTISTWSRGNIPIMLHNGQLTRTGFRRQEKEIVRGKTTGERRGQELVVAHHLIQIPVPEPPSSRMIRLPSMETLFHTGSIPGTNASSNS